VPIEDYYFVSGRVNLICYGPLKAPVSTKESTQEDNEIIYIKWPERILYIHIRSLSNTQCQRWVKDQQIV